jgi:hypothetical protein
MVALESTKRLNFCFSPKLLALSTTKTVKRHGEIDSSKLETARAVNSALFQFKTIAATDRKGGGTLVDFLIA